MERDVDNKQLFQNVGNFIAYMAKHISYVNEGLELKVNDDKTKQFYANLGNKFMDLS
jgi:hypothetical protein